MDKRIVTSAYKNEMRPVLDIADGGTSMISVDSARYALSAVPNSDKGQAYGIALLNANALIPNEQMPFTPGTERPSIIGPKETYSFIPIQFQITNYDSNTVYNIAANHGNVTINGDTISYQVDYFEGIDVVMVNAKSFGIRILPSHQEKPTFAAPINNAVDVPINPMFHATPHWVGYQDFATYNEWELTPQGGEAVVSSTTWGVLDWSPQLELNTAYTLRVRISGMLLGTGDWSDPVTFVTTA